MPDPSLATFENLQYICHQMKITISDIWFSRIENFEHFYLRSDVWMSEVCITDNRYAPSSTYSNQLRQVTP